MGMDKSMGMLRRSSENFAQKLILRNELHSAVGELSLHVSGAEMCSGSFPTLGLGWGIKVSKWYDKHKTVLASIWILCLDGFAIKALELSIPQLRTEFQPESNESRPGPSNHRFYIAWGSFVYIYTPDHPPYGGRYVILLLLLPPR